MILGLGRLVNSIKRSLFLYRFISFFNLIVYIQELVVIGQYRFKA